MNRLRLFLRDPNKLLLASCVLLAVVLLAMRLKGASRAPQSQQLATPLLAIEALHAKSLYFNDAARPWLLAHRPDLLTEEDQLGTSERSRGLIQAVQNPTLFRKLDRRFHFDALLLTGDPSQYRPLLDHLLQTKDWTLTYLDHSSLIFRRDNSQPWQPEALATLRPQFTTRSEQAVFLAQAASKLLAVKMPEPAKALLEEAERLDSHALEIRSALAIYYSNRGEWSKAMSQVDRALAQDKDYAPAIGTKTQILYSTKRFDEALTLSTKLLATQPDNPSLLFYHARIAKERHAFEIETEVLRKLIALAELENHPTATYRVFLGQSLAKQGQAQPAIAEFTRALADPDLPADQRKFASELLTQIKTRAGL
jgi:tetratricopeptide (TPR) repeat protein